MWQEQFCATVVIYLARGRDESTVGSVLSDLDAWAVANDGRFWEPSCCGSAA
jgi:hypothetical protein